MTDFEERVLRRREALIALGALGTGAVLIGCGTDAPSAAQGAAACTLTPETTEGPYWVDLNLTRRDVRDGHKGVPLALSMTVQDQSSCKPIKGADVEIWHADAAGVYSGVQGNTKRFLRGHQRANASGVVLFTTIYPGWYQGRTPHIHVKVHVGGSEVHTGQLFFRDSTSKQVYATSAYKSRGTQDTSNGDDMIYADAGGSKALVKLKRRSASSLAKGFTGAATLVVQT
jgi:protocatechuate 3,4-dioxygenase beta subunit